MLQSILLLAALCCQVEDLELLLLSSLVASVKQQTRESRFTLCCFMLQDLQHHWYFRAKQYLIICGSYKDPYTHWNLLRQSSLYFKIDRTFKISDNTDYFTFQYTIYVYSSQMFLSTIWKALFHISNYWLLKCVRNSNIFVLLSILYSYLCSHSFNLKIKTRFLGSFMLAQNIKQRL